MATTTIEVLTFDPGGTTGWAWMRIPIVKLLEQTDFASLYNAIEWDCGELTGTENWQADQAIGMVELRPGCGVVVEDFVLHKFNRDRELLSPVRVTAKIEYGVYMLNRVAPGGRTHGYAVQSLSDANKAMPDARLQETGFWEVGKEHARDATRHGVTFLRRCRQNHSLLREMFKDEMMEVG